MFSGAFDRSQRRCTWNDPQVFPVLTAQWPWEIETLAGLVAQRGPRVIVEIGTQEGGTLRYWLEAAASDARIVAIDPAMYIHGLEDERLILRNTRSDDPETIALVKELGIDFLFIDGDHMYEPVRYDFMTYGPMVRPGGVIAFHDIYTLEQPETCQVPQLWKEICEAGYITQELLCMHARETPGGGIGIVYL